MSKIKRFFKGFASGLKKTREFFKRNYRNIITTALFIPPIWVSIVSMSHLIGWWSISNPFFWALFLAIAVEIAALSSLAAIVSRVGKGTLYVIFIAMTALQFMGNSYFHFDYMMNQLEANPEYLSNWITFTKSIFELFFIEVDKVIIIRWTALFKGFWIPVISLSFLHVLVKRFDKLYGDDEIIKQEQSSKEETEEEVETDESEDEQEEEKDDEDGEGGEPKKK